jgi:hypothetical protein
MYTMINDMYIICYRNTVKHFLYLASKVKIACILLLNVQNIVIAVIYFSDIDECHTKPCSHLASCQNVLGSFTCSCNPGYFGNGFTCTDGSYKLLYLITGSEIMIKSDFKMTYFSRRKMLKNQ